MNALIRTLGALALVGRLADAAFGADAMGTLRAGTLQGVSGGVGVVVGDDTGCSLLCFTSSGFVVEGEAGMGGLKAALGIGLADRIGDERGLLTLKLALFRSWGSGLMTPAASVFVGPEVDVANRWGFTLGLLKRVDDDGWRLSAALVRVF